MKSCPFCTADIPDEAAKCKHCGEWVDGRSSSGERDREQTVNVRWVPSEGQLKLFKWHLVAGVIGTLICTVVFFLFFSKAWNDHERFKQDVDQRQKEHRGK